MTPIRKVTILLLAMAALIFLPWIGATIYHGKLLPDTYFAFPELNAKPKAPFHIVAFTIIALSCLFITLLYIFPYWFGFKRVPKIPVKPVKKVKLPTWFWIGLLFWGVTLIMLWTKSKIAVEYLHWSDFPLFWGFVLVIDGWVYVRNGGKSLLSVVPQEIIAIGGCSILGWMIFEYLNIYLNDNWYYPKGFIIDREQFLLYACIVSSGLLPLTFEWYSLLQTFPNFTRRYTEGPKVTFSKPLKNITLVVTLIALFCLGIFPNLLFFSLWLFPPLILLLALDKVGVWSPFKELKNGNWSPIAVFALTYFIQGFLLEFQNYFSGFHQGGNVSWTEEPAYWMYNIPYVDILHVFEMPLLGFWGYLPFGIYCWIWWIACATVMGIPSKFYEEKPLKPNFEE